MTRLSIRHALNKAHYQLLDEDEAVIVIGEDIVGGAGTGADEELGGVFGVTSGLAEHFGKARVIDTPISETAFVGMGIGAAATGLKPIIEIMFCDFMGVCFDQILNQAAKMRFLSGDHIKLPLVIRTTMGAGDSSAAMHSQSLHGLLASIPGLKVACPSNAADAAGLLKSALLDPNPVILMEHKGLYDHTSATLPTLPAVPLGKGRIVNEGTDITIVAASAMLHEAIKAAEQLTQTGIQAEVLDPRTISPLDTDLIISSISKTGHLLVVDEGAAFAGFADAVIAYVSENAFRSLKQAPKKLVPPHTPIPYGPDLEQEWLPATADIVKSVRTICSE